MSELNKKKQIEEMANILVNGCKMGGCEECKYSEGTFPECALKYTANQLYNAGYRKASEVAREIFEEIEKKVKASIVVYLEEINKEHIKDTPLYDRCSGIVFALKGMDDFLTELKKKYTEGEK